MHEAKNKNQRWKSKLQRIVTEKSPIRIWLLIPFVCHLQTHFSYINKRLLYILSFFILFGLVEVLCPRHYAQNNEHNCVEKVERNES